MKNLKIVVLILLLLGFGISGASALSVGLVDYAFNIDGVISEPLLGDPVPYEADISGFDETTGLGSLQVTINGAGLHYVGLFVDHEIDEPVNTYFNEFGAASGLPAAGQTWEIDEPGYVFGDIRTDGVDPGNFESNALDNNNGVPFGSEDDVAMALAWDFTLGAGEIAMIDYVLGPAVPFGFHLIHTDPDSNASFHFSSELTIAGGPAPVPEPGTILLMSTGLGGLIGLGQRRFMKK